MKLLRSNKILILLVVLAAAAWKLVFFFWDVVPFNSDEAIVGLMARHILAGERPIFFYGQAYMGSLDAFLVAGAFWVFGPQVWCIRLVQSLLYLGTVLTTIFIGREAFGTFKPGLIAAVLLAFPAVNLALYTTASLGGYGEALLLGNLILLLALVVARRHIELPLARFPAGWFVLWSLLVGVGLWANGLTLVYSAPAGLYLLWDTWRCRRAWLAPFLAACLAGFLVGAMPWWLYALANGTHRLLLELFGNAVAVERETWLARTGNHLVSFLLLGTSVIFGFRPPWGVVWLGLPLIPFLLIFWFGACGFFVKRLLKSSPDRSRYFLLGGVGAVLLAGFLFTPFGVDPSGRYFLPLALPLGLVAAQMVLSISRRPWHVLALVALVAVFQLVGTVQCMLRYPPGLTTQFYEPTVIDHSADQALIDFLQQHGEYRGYTNYWVAYPLAFRSQEQLIFAPRLPYHLDLRYTPRDDRYPPYQLNVEQSPRTAYITTRNPLLDQKIRAQFTGLGITWQEQKIGDYQVYYHLSRAVRPQEIGLGELTQ
jgi:4-amino-4-deoxy-L-arabinose transferase-like glycosyltransferase